jgi:ankyrin repeat protein
MIMFGKKTPAVLLAAWISFFCTPASAALSDEQFLNLCANGSAAQVRDALDAGARIEARDQQGGAALMYAASSKRREVASLLLDRGANINARDDFGITALGHTVQSGAGNDPLLLETLSLLLKRGADVNVRSNTGLTPLMLAANGNPSPQVIGLLLAAGAEVNAADNDGFTPLLFAAFSSGPETVAVLLAAGADARARDRLHGKMVADYAAENKKLQGSHAYRLLLERAQITVPQAPQAIQPLPMMGMQPRPPSR